MTSSERKSKHIKKYNAIDSLLSETNYDDKSPIYIQHTKLGKALAGFQILKNGAKISEALKLAKDLCKTAKKYGLLRYCIEPSGFLFRYYSKDDYNRTKALNMRKLNIESINTFTLEVMVDRYYSDLLLVQRSPHSKKYFLETSIKLWSEIEPHINQINSFDFHRIGFMIGLTYYRAKSDWPQTELLSLKAVRYFESFILKSNPILSVYYRQYINAKLTQGKTHGITELLTNYKSLVRKDSPNWFLFQYTHARIKLINNEYTEAFDIINTAAQTRGYNSIPKMNKLAFDIVYAYNLYALHYRNKEIDIPESLLLGRDKDFFSDHYKLQLLIIKLIYFCHHKQWKLVETSSAAISKFLSRKLIRQGQSRSYNFINMLLQLSERQFHHLAIKRHTNRFQAKLLAQPCQATGSEQDYEIIPYETLWDMIMENLKK